jgi:hypothetical protein
METKLEACGFHPTHETFFPLNDARKVWIARIL